MTNIKPRAYTEEEVREMFLSHIKSSRDYWISLGKNVEETVDGVIFSTLVMLDGGCVDLPGFRVSPCPHESDKKYHIDNGENYFSKSVNISGCLHDDWSKRKC